MSNDNFGARLERMLIDRGMTQTDLARKMWNETYVDKRGYEVVKGKDCISGYISGRRQPSRLVYEQMLRALNLTQEELPLLRRGSTKANSRREMEIEELKREIVWITRERDHWKDTAAKMSELALSMAKGERP